MFSENGHKMIAMNNHAFRVDIVKNKSKTVCGRRIRQKYVGSGDKTNIARSEKYFRLSRKNILQWG